MKKRLFSIICICVITFCSFCYADESSLIDFNANMTKLIGNEKSASEIISSSMTRALFSVCLMLDLDSASDIKTTFSSTNVFFNDSFVSMTNGVLLFNCYDDVYLYSIYYSPLFPSKAQYSRINIVGASKSGIEAAIRENVDKCYMNSYADMIDVVQQLQEIMNK